MKMNQTTLNHYKESRQYLKSKTKTLLCKKCGKELTVSVFRSSNIVCEDCKKKESEQSKIYKEGLKCQTCGELFYKDYRKDLYRIPPRFCSEYCAKKHATIFSKNLTKIVYCKNCNKPVEVGIHCSSNYICKDCKKKIRKNVSKKVNLLNKKIYEFSEESELGRFERSQAYKQKSKNLEKLGFDFTAPLSQEYFKLKSLLTDLYIKEELSTLCIKEMYDIPSTLTVPNFLRLCNIPIRSLKDASFIGIKAGRLKQLNSLDHIRNVYKCGYYEDIFKKKHYLRSSLEFDLAKKLDSLNLSFDTEVEIEYLNSSDSRLHHGYPDFYLPKYNLFIETKGSCFYDEQNLKDRAEAIAKLGKNFLVLTYDVNKKEKTLVKLDNFNNLDIEIIKQFL